jgi:hypothetical protein
MTTTFFARLMLVMILISCALMLGACGNQPTTPVWKYQTILIVPDQSMMQQCPVEPPPPKATYMAADAQGREGLLTTAYSNQTKDISLCNQGIGRLNTWVAQQKALYPNAIASAPAAASAPQ